MAMATETEERDPDSSRAQRLKDLSVARTALISSCVVVCVGVGLALVWRLRVIVLLIIVSLFVAALLHPIVRFVERLGVRRSIATIAVFFFSLAAAVTLGYVLVHPVYTSATNFARELPRIVRQAQQGKGQIGHLVRRLSLESYVKKNVPHLESLISGLGRPALAIGRTVVGGIVALFSIAVLTFFILLEAPRTVRTVLAGLRPEHAARARKILGDVGHAVNGYMLGNFATSIIAGVVVYGALKVMGVRYAGVLAIWVCIVDFLPLVGGLLAGVPAVAVAALHSLPAGIVTLVVFLVYQQIENHILNPIVMSKTVRLNALWVLLAILAGVELGGIVGSTLGGLVGALLAVPAASVLQVVARDLWLERRADSGEEEGSVEASSALGKLPEASR
jgi:predicted PurR-regulated permease PerM